MMRRGSGLDKTVREGGAEETSCLLAKGGGLAEHLQSQRKVKRLPRTGRPDIQGPALPSGNETREGSRYWVTKPFSAFAL